ncbi:MAG TPA: S8/S53 family peptidase [Ktedonobacteraceae bacterium]|nr:S8/S53 family peptidase [Ktedonobacteraceae bacterium]
MPEMEMASMAPKQAVYWRKNQAIVTFFSLLSIDAQVTAVAQFVDDQIQQLNIQALNTTSFLLERMKPQGIADPLDGVFVYSAPARTMGNVHFADVAVLCSINQKPEQTCNPAMPDDDNDDSREVVKLLNDYELTGSQPISFRAMPNWLWTGVPDETHGCPVTPPFPANNHGRDGRWHTVFPEGLPEPIREATGTGVTVIVLDAFPSPEQIYRAGHAAATQNTLLSELANGLVSEAPWQASPPSISLDYTYAIPGPEETAVTGKDVYGRLSGFPMADHGLFSVGLIRDLAPTASIECVRVLNDFGVGDSATLIRALTSIETRLRNKGDLLDRSVIINLSLVVGPPECDLARLGLTSHKGEQQDLESLPELLSGLYNLLSSITRLGGIFVCSVGNDSDPRDFMMNPTEVRFGARYPAAFANHHPDYVPLAAIIPVGAANQEGMPAAYSNYPGLAGFTTYGGELPRPRPWLPSASSHAYAQVDTSNGSDVLYGVYTGEMYPALSRNDQYDAEMPAQQESSVLSYPAYEAPLSSGWACWSGTSFAAPIITALVARVTQSTSDSPYGLNVREILTAAGKSIEWKRLATGRDAVGLLIMATQLWQDYQGEPPDQTSTEQTATISL